MMPTTTALRRRSLSYFVAPRFAKFALVFTLWISACGPSKKTVDARAGSRPSKSVDNHANSGKTEINPKPNPGQIQPSPRTPPSSSTGLNPTNQPHTEVAQTTGNDASTTEGSHSSAPPGASAPISAKDKRLENDNPTGNAQNLTRKSQDRDSRPPKCVHQGSRSEGWQAADGRMIKKTRCKDIEPQCLYPKTRSEGWYANKELIEYSRCTRSPSERPVCVKSGTRSEGWAWPDGTFIEYAQCKDQKPECKHQGSKSEGWYFGEILIVFVSCTQNSD